MKVAAGYDARLGGVERPKLLAGTSSAYHIYPVLVENRDAIVEKMKVDGIDTNVHYPVPSHLQPGFSMLGYKPGAFPHTERLADMELSLPIFPELTGGQLDRVATSLLRAIG